MSATSRSGAAAAAAAAAQLEPVLEAGGRELAGLLASTEARLAEVIEGYGETLAGYAAGTLAAGGKRLRPILVFVCGGAGGDPAAREEPLCDTPAGTALVRAGVAVELLHMATLVHDDVLDRASLRRGRPTVFSSAGRAAATATGDLLFSRAFAELVATNDVDAVRALSSASSALARGELMQRSDAWRAEVSPDRYLERCELKTASLFAAACALGDPALAGFGTRIGLAFQMLDDVLDVAGPPERTGKARGTDLLDGTVTLPFILARERDPALARLDLRATVRTPVDAEAVCERIAATGALDAARERALGIVAAAKDELPAVLGERQRHALELVADGVVERFA